MTAMLAQDEFHIAARNGTARGAIVTRQAEVLQRVGDAESRVFRFVFSDASVDRMGDTIAVDGWDLTAFQKNPVILFAHDSSAPPIGRAVNIFSDGTRLLGDIEFVTPEIYEFGHTIYKLIKGGFLKAGSVGFLPIEYEFSEDDDRPYGIDFKAQELLEFSVCPVGANANALIAARAKNLINASQFRRLQGAIRRAPLPPTPTPEPLSVQAKAARLRRLANLRERVGLPATPVEVEALLLSPTEARQRAAHIRRAFYGQKHDPAALAAESAFRLTI